MATIAELGGPVFMMLRKGCSIHKSFMKTKKFRDHQISLVSQ